MWGWPGIVSICYCCWSRNAMPVISFISSFLHLPAADTFQQNKTWDFCRGASETTFLMSFRARPVPMAKALAASQPRRPLARGSLSSWRKQKRASQTSQTYQLEQLNNGYRLRDFMNIEQICILYTCMLYRIYLYVYIYLFIYLIIFFLRWRSISTQPIWESRLG